MINSFGENARATKDSEQTIAHLDRNSFKPGIISD
jgi:hypothetical protein